MEEKQPAPKLPEFEKPPVNEVVIGVQFDQIENFGAVHPGMYWQTIQKKYPKVSDQIPLGSASEFFGSDKPPKPVAKFTTMPPIRLGASASSSARLTPTSPSYPCRWQ